MNPAEVNDALCKDVLAAVKFIFPIGGKVGGGRFTIGDIHGSSGSSLFVYLNNGNWREANGSHPNGGGDLLELFAYKFGDKKAAFKEALRFLGINKGSESTKRRELKKVAAPVKKWTQPQVEWIPIVEGSRVDMYLKQTRLIDPSVMPSIYQNNSGDSMYFITVTHDEKHVPCGAFRLGVDRNKVQKDDGTVKYKKDVSRAPNELSVLFGHESCRKDIRDKDGRTFLIITEGQIDAATYRMHGFDNAVSIPSGVDDTGWIQNSWDFIQQFDLVYLSFDNDDAGDKCYNTVSGRLGIDKCRRILIDDQYNDANEAHVKTSGKYSLKQCIYDAKEYRPAELVSAYDLIDEVIARLEEGPRNKKGIPFMGWIGESSINLNFRPKEMTVWTGYPGAGKSNVIYQLIASLIFSFDQTVFLASLEEDMEDIIGIIAMHALIEPFSPQSKWKYIRAIELVREKLWIYRVRDRVKYKDLIEVSDYAVRRFGAQHCFLDSAAKTDIDIDDHGQVFEMMGAFTSSMNNMGSHWHLVAHSRKGDLFDRSKIPGLAEIKGSAQIGIETFNVVTVWRNYIKQKALDSAERKTLGRNFNPDEKLPDKSYSINDARSWPDLYICVSKDKVGGTFGEFGCYYDLATKRVRRIQDQKDYPYIIITDNTPNF